jgi:alanine racemase
MIRLDSVLPEGTEAEIFGPHISLEEMAEDLHTIPYEIICLISSRVTRKYIRDGKKYDEENTRMVRSRITK